MSGDWLVVSLSLISTSLRCSRKRSPNLHRVSVTLIVFTSIANGIFGVFNFFCGQIELLAFRTKETERIEPYYLIQKHR